MNFYGIQYLKSQSNINDYLKYFFIFGSLIVLVVVFSLYLRHRLETKYRDLSIIFFLFLLFSLGVQYSDYQNNETKHSQSSQMVNFVERLSDTKKIGANEIYVNSTELVDGIIVKINQSYYTVKLSPDQSSYTLNETYLIGEAQIINK
ncbi:MULTISPECIES: DUF3290 domain-containing protein [unclassified Enterococcus]|uniref:DUF3290 domain-containing protein n=1 Tax=unclassified Enterococcus TaxID=2608891 RepID=UPI0015578D20|nr:MULTISPECIES: DUF3290 domain-containing protein [unclassified Enterococcus]MBS7577847.1 DUF3290 domain-containing protein [Enterococcus sp. MMGLQ5-2]MBS7585107.1 DUF3290 domain-containing protein [Enterococcus sp. MMGLQ5-1]NPD12963.1 DUF3290 domain-containing protein [Enterococcus sp. MMGLQ5-1]NPD37677.1 DUF3290 domain-containing protein [Enterococcus sp. MMGLQ5-2]